MRYKTILRYINCKLDLAEREKKKFVKDGNLFLVEYADIDILAYTLAKEKLEGEKDAK